MMSPDDATGEKTFGSYTFVGPNVDCLPEEDKNSYIAAGKALSYLMKMEVSGSCGLEKASVYGSAVAIPQIARSTNWCRSMTGFAIRAYMFLVINIMLQVFLVSMIGEEVHLNNMFSGKMHMCSFGQDMEDCPGAPNCIGPGGTPFSFDRLYDFGTWSTRTFVRDSLLKIFPEKSDVIRSVVDPGEYGMENFYCRLVCCFFFMMGVTDDFRKTVHLGLLLINVPTTAEKWIRYEFPAWESKERVKDIHGLRELDLVKYGVAGMPLVWKIVNVIFVLMPKFCIWLSLALCGTHFLMETSGLLDLIMNCVALTFILSLDEMVFATFATVAVKHMLGECQDFELFEVVDEEQEADEVALHRFCRDELHSFSFARLSRMLVPTRLIFVASMMAVFYSHYYLANCQMEEDGSWVSKPIHSPTSIFYNPMAFIFPLKIFGWEEAPSVLWEMPSGPLSR